VLARSGPHGTESGAPQAAGDRGPAIVDGVRARGPTTILLVLVALLIGCGDEDAAPTTEGRRAPASAAPAPADATPEPTGGARESSPQPGASPEARQADETNGPQDRATPSTVVKDRAANEAEGAYIAYVDAINERDGVTLCELLPSTAERELRPPAGGNSCAERLGKSIGHADPRGYPVWSRTVFNGVESLSIGDDPSTARLTAAIVTEFQDRDEPSVESDIAYLEIRGGEWRLAKPTGALYRAIGRPELPPTVIAPP